MTDRKPLILNAVDLSDPPGDRFKVALFTEAPEPAPTVDHGYETLPFTPTGSAAHGNVVWCTWWWMEPAPPPARPWKLPYNRLSKARRRRRGR